MRPRSQCTAGIQTASKISWTPSLFLKDNEWHYGFSMLLICMRATIGPFLLLDAIDGSIGSWFLWLFVAGVLSDVVDGELLRRQQLSDPKCRSLDSSTDAVFYMSVLVSMWFVHPAAIRSHSLLITFLLLTQLVSWALSLSKFGKTTSYHSYVAKVWGLALFFGTVNFFTWRNELLLMLPLAVGIISNIEDMVITAVIPFWKTDVTGIPAALRLQRDKRTRGVSAHSLESHGLILKKVCIDRSAIVGLNAIVMPGVTIGERAVIDAGVFVPKDTIIAPETTYLGK